MIARVATPALLLEAPTGMLAFGLVGALGISALAVYSPAVTVGLAVASVLVVVSVANLTYGVTLFVLLTFFETLPGLDGLALSRPMGLVLVVSWLVALAQGKREHRLLSRDRPALAFALVTFVAWSAISAAWSVDSTTTISSAFRLGLIAVLFFVVYTALESVRDLAIVSWTFLVGAFLATVVALATGANKSGRLALGELDPNFLAAALVAALVLALFLLTADTQPAVRVLLVAFMALYAVGIVATESRGGVVAALGAGILAIAFGGRLRPRLAALILVVAALGVGYYSVVAPYALQQRLSTTVESDQNRERIALWTISRKIAEQHPLGGVGLGNFRTVQTQYLSSQLDIANVRKLRSLPLVAHNTYLEVLSELGLVGVALFASIVGMSVARGVGGARRISDEDPTAEPVVRGLVVATMSLLVSYFFVSGLYEKQLWLLLGVLAAVPAAARASRSHAPLSQWPVRGPSDSIS